MIKVLIQEIVNSDTDKYSAYVYIQDVIVEVNITNIFSDDEENALEWYFEDYIHFPFIGQTKAKDVSNSIFRYGENLFHQIFGHPRLYELYNRIIESGEDKFIFEIEGSPSFQGLHWETLKDPKLPLPFSFYSQVIRKVPSNTFKNGHDKIKRTRYAINLLIVTARIDVENDINPRTISRPLIEMIKEEDIPVNIQILRPGTYKALTKHLRSITEEYGPGYYDIIHFDVHGALLTFQHYMLGLLTKHIAKPELQERQELIKYDEEKPFIFLETDVQGQVDAVTAEEIGTLLTEHAVAIVILNACQSSKQVGCIETSFIGTLAKSGIKAVLGMRYSLTVSAAKIIMKTLYIHILDGLTLADAIIDARIKLYNNKLRNVNFNEAIELDDWMLPIVYEQQIVKFSFKKANMPNKELQKSRIANLQGDGVKSFVGRDIDILNIEKALLSEEACQGKNVLLIAGMIGIGKSALLQHLSFWWEQTNFVEQVIYFDSSKENWNYKSFISKLFNLICHSTNTTYCSKDSNFFSEETNLINKLRLTRYAIVIDNFFNIANQNSIKEKDLQNIKSVIEEICGGETIVIIGVRNENVWITKGLQKVMLYRLSTLDYSSVSLISKGILENLHRLEYLTQKDFMHLIDLADGVPLALEFILRSLIYLYPEQVKQCLMSTEYNNTHLQSIFSGNKALESIEHAYEQLSKDTQMVLLALSPFTNVIYRAVLPQYIERLHERELLIDILPQRCESALQEAADCGFITTYPQMPSCLRLNPLLIFFLRARIQLNEQYSGFSQLDNAFVNLYQDYSMSITSKYLNSSENEILISLIGLEVENLIRAIKIGINSKVSIQDIIGVLSEYWKITKSHNKMVKLGEEILEQVGQETVTNITDQDTLTNLLVVKIDLGSHYLSLGQYEKSEVLYKDAIHMIDVGSNFPDYIRSKVRGVLLHDLALCYKAKGESKQAIIGYKDSLSVNENIKEDILKATNLLDLGILSREQRFFKDALGYYLGSLKIAKRLKDEKMLTKIYHEIGFLAQETGKYKVAKKFYNKSLSLCSGDFNSQVKTRLNRGINFYLMNEYNMAKADLKIALEISLKTNDFLLQAKSYTALGGIAFEEANWEEAKDYYLKGLSLYEKIKNEKGIAISIGNLAILSKKADILDLPDLIANILKTSKKKILELMSRVGRQEENNFDNLNISRQMEEQAREYYMKGNYKEAINVLDKIVELYPDYSKNYYNRSIAHRFNGNIHDAIKDLNEVIRLQPDDSGAFFDRGNYKSFLNDLNGALEDYNEAIRIEPDIGDYYSNRSSIYLEFQDYESALQDLDKALRLNPYDAISYLARANIYKASQKIKLAMDDYNAAIGSMVKLFDIELKKADIPDEEAKKAVRDKIKKLEVRCYLARADAKCMVADFSGGIEDCTYIINKYPNNSDAYSDRAVAYLEIGDLQRAFDDCKTAIDMNPDDAFAYYNLACVYSLLHDNDNAFFVLEKSLSLRQEFISKVFEDNDLQQIRKDFRFKELVDKYTCL